MRNYRLECGDCLILMRGLEAGSVDAVVTDPPYGLTPSKNATKGFFDLEWDAGVPTQKYWEECLRVLKPGGHLIAFSSARTYHRLACNVEDAGFELRDQLIWIYGSGFPKSFNISKGIDKKFGKERVVVGESRSNSSVFKSGSPTWKEELPGDRLPAKPITAPGCEESAKWDGWGTALKPAHEPCVLARKPFKGTVVENVLTNGVGGINIDACKVGDEIITTAAKTHVASPQSGLGKTGYSGCEESEHIGRWPTNIMHDGSDEVLVVFPKGASRFYYCAKSSSADRDAGLSELDSVERKRTMSGGADTRGRPTPINKNTHPCVKPTALMQYLVRLVTPPEGVVLDPFMGSGSTGRACMKEGFDFIGFDLDPEYVRVAELRIRDAQASESLFED